MFKEKYMIDKVLVKVSFDKHQLTHLIYCLF